MPSYTNLVKVLSSLLDEFRADATETVNQGVTQDNQYTEQLEQGVTQDSQENIQQRLLGLQEELLEVAKETLQQIKELRGGEF